MDENSRNRVREAPSGFNLGVGSNVDRSVGIAAVPSGTEQKHYRAKVFKSGNSLALRLPAALGLEAGMEMDLKVGPDGSYTLRRADAPKRKIDGSKFIGKAPWLKPLTREEREFEESPRPWDDPDWPGWEVRRK